MFLTLKYVNYVFKKLYLSDVSFPIPDFISEDLICCNGLLFVVYMFAHLSVTTNRQTVSKSEKYLTKIHLKIVYIQKTIDYS